MSLIAQSGLQDSHQFGDGPEWDELYENYDAGWADFLAENEAIRSNTSVCLKITDPWFAALSDEVKAEAAKKIAGVLESRRHVA